MPKIRIWPWSTISDLRKHAAVLDDLLAQKRAEIRECDTIIASWQKKYSELERRAEITKGHNEQLTRQVGEYKQEAAKDVRSGYIMHDRQQATDIKFRSVKVDLQVMKKICKQANLAIRYAAQHVPSNAIQSDLRRIAELIHPDSFNEMGIDQWSSADMVADTRSMQELIRLSNGKDADL